MNSKIIRSLLITFLISMISGLLSLLLFEAFLGDYGQDEFGIRIVGGMIIDFLVTGFVCVVVFLPIAITDKQKMQDSFFEELLARYLPLFVLPLGTLICVALFARYDHDGEHSLFVTTALNITCVCYTALYTFIKLLKTQP